MPLRCDMGASAAWRGRQAQVSRLLPAGRRCRRACPVPVSRFRLVSRRLVTPAVWLWSRPGPRPPPPACRIADSGSAGRPGRDRPRSSACTHRRLSGSAVVTWCSANSTTGARDCQTRVAILPDGQSRPVYGPSQANRQSTKARNHPGVTLRERVEVANDAKTQGHAHRHAGREPGDDERNQRLKLAAFGELAQATHPGPSITEPGSTERCFPLARRQAAGKYRAVRDNAPARAHRFRDLGNFGTLAVAGSLSRCSALPCVQLRARP